MHKVRRSAEKTLSMVSASILRLLKVVGSFVAAKIQRNLERAIFPRSPLNGRPRALIVTTGYTVPGALPSEPMPHRYIIFMQVMRGSHRTLFGCHL
jgi:hypothetical protein